MEKEGIKINDMVIHVAGEKIPLSLDKATKLMDLLDSLFIEKIVRKVDDKNNFYDRYYYPYITPIERPNFPPINPRSFYLNYNTLHLTVYSNLYN